MGLFRISATLAAAWLAWGGIAFAQTQPALSELDAIISEIRERYLGEAPRPILENVSCGMSVDELVQSYIQTHRLFEQYDAAVQRAADAERAANTAIVAGNFCDRSLVQQQSRAIDGVEGLDLDGVLLAAQKVAECAPVLQETAELRIPALRSPAQLAVLQQEIDTLRTMRGHALQIASRMGFARDLRRRVVEVMEGNVAVCR